MPAQRDFLSVPEWVQQAFRKDPRFGYLAYLSLDEVPQTFGYSASFTSTAQDQGPVVLEPDQAIPSDMYIQEMGYDVERPNFAPGSVLAAPSNLANAQQPGLKILLEVGGGFLGDQYNINIGLSKIQMVVPWVQRLGQSQCAWPGKWFMTYSQQLVVNVFLSRALGDTEVPYEVSMVLRAKRIKCPGWQSMTMQDVRQKLQDVHGLSGLPDFQLNEKYELQGLGRNPDAPNLVLPSSHHQEQSRGRRR